jgi:hypothetical protein
MPLAPPPLDPTAIASSPAVRWGTGRQTSDGELRLGSPVIDWWRWFDRGGRRQAAAEAQRRSGGRGGAAAGTRTAVRKGAPLNNVLHRELPCGLGKTLGRSPGTEDRRRGELDGGGPTAAAGARAPAIVGLGLINKRLRELL